MQYLMLKKKKQMEHLLSWRYRNQIWWVWSLGDNLIRSKSALIRNAWAESNEYFCLLLGDIKLNKMAYLPAHAFLINALLILIRLSPKDHTHQILFRYLHGNRCYSLKHVFSPLINFYKSHDFQILQTNLFS